MNAMLLHKPGPIETRPLAWADVPPPRPGPCDVVLRVAVCGVCHTDLHEIEGDLPMHGSPRIPGHQIVGRVVERGDQARRFETGQRVGAAWLHETCGRCGFCSRGRENLCEHARFTGWDVDGGYAEYVRVPEAFAYPLPDALADEHAAPLLCAGIIGYRALRACGIEPSQRLGLYGFGASAHVVIQIARHWGCEVFVFTRGASHRALAQSLGAAWVGGADDEPPARMDGSVIFAPAGSLVPPALRALERGGTLALAGIHMSRIPALDYARHLYDERVVRSVAHATRRDGEELLELAAAVPLRTTVTPLRLDEANEALLRLKTGRIDGAAVLRVTEESTAPA